MGWGIWDGNPGYLATEHFSETVADEATFTFTGVKARYYGFSRPDLGYAELLLDGVSEGVVDCYSDVSDYDVMLYETPELSNAQHTLTVRVAGSKNPASSGTEVVVDAFAFLPGDPLLDIALAGPNQTAISWPSYYPGWVLQEAESLTSTNWVNAPGGGTNFVSLPATGPSKFYRLYKP